MLVAKKWIKMPSLLVEQYNQKDALPRDLYLHGLLNNEQLRIKKKSSQLLRERYMETNIEQMSLRFDDDKDAIYT